MMPTPFSAIRIFVMLCSLAPLTCFALNYSVKIDAPPGLLELLTQHLPLVVQQQDTDLDQAGLDSLVNATPATVSQLLETEGYFSPQVKVTTQEGAVQTIHVEVTPGEPVVVQSVALRLVGPVLSQPDLAVRQQSLQDKWSLPKGAVFRQAAWDAGKLQALRQLQADRFPLAQISASRVEIDPVSHQAQVYLTLDSGPEIRFGALEIKGLSRYPRKLVDTLADFKPGDPYTLQSLLNFQSALEQGSQFADVVVSTDLTRIQNGEVPVQVELKEAPLKKLELGLTYDSEVGPGTRIGFDHYNLFNQGWTGSSVWSWDRMTNSLGVGLSFPRDSTGFVNSLTGQLKRTNIQGLMTESAEVGVWRTRTQERNELRFGLDYLQESQRTNGVPSQTNHALIPSVGWTLRTVDNLLHPRTGALLDGTLSATPGSLLSSTHFVRAYGRGVLYWTPSSGWGTWLARLELGQVWAGDATQVPASQLFRAGGVNSVRGYDYQSLGIPGPSGSVLGGAVLATSTLEYQIPIVPNWALALFVDAGDAAGNWQSFQVKKSRGIGVRWFSPVAPFSVDIAQAEGQRGLSFHMGLGLAF